MISIPLDEAFCYDLLAIALVKQGVADTPINRQNVERLDYAIEQQVGPVHRVILSSPEFAALRATNQRLFDYVDLVKNKPDPDKCYDVEVDAEVYNRYLGKKALQERFFPESAITEQKIGYKEGGK